MPSKRPDGRRADQLRPLKLRPGFVGSADGSCLIELGRTRVICTASIEAGVPPWSMGQGLGWVTAEYAMLPASTGARKRRAVGKPDSRGTEIQRLLGRALRSGVRFDRLGEHTIPLDCDVLEADGGTRVAAISGAYVALAAACKVGVQDGRFRRGVLAGAIAAVSVAMTDGKFVLDPCYAEDVAADVDLNVAMTGGGHFVEVQATGEGGTFDDDALRRMLRLARRGVRQILRAQRQALGKEAKR